MMITLALNMKITIAMKVMKTEQKVLLHPLRVVAKLSERYWKRLSPLRLGPAQKILSLSAVNSNYGNV